MIRSASALIVSVVAYTQSAAGGRLTVAARAGVAANPDSTVAITRARAAIRPNDMEAPGRLVAGAA